MKVWLPLLLCAALLGGVLSCRKSDKSPIPFIALISVSPDSVKTLSPLDTVFITFNFSDGDGDLGNDLTQGVYDIYLDDTRDSAIEELRYPFPEIPADAIDPIDGITGSGAIALVASNIAKRTDSIHFFRDTLSYRIWIVDRARHMSNVVYTPPIYLHP